LIQEDRRLSRRCKIERLQRLFFWSGRHARLKRSNLMGPPGYAAGETAFYHAEGRNRFRSTHEIAAGAAITHWKASLHGAQGA
jgi:hypothetical protein